MSLVPALDFRDDDFAARQLPHNLDAEQALLGSILYDNEAFHGVDGLEARHFYEPFHGRLFEAVARCCGNDQLAEPVLLADGFKQDPAFHDLGGMAYLADLVDRAPPAANAPDYARAVRDMAMRRDLIRLADQIGQAASEGAGQEVLEWAEGAIYSAGAGAQDRVRLITAREAAEGVLAYLDAPEDTAGGVQTGIQPLDEHLGRLLGGDLVLLPGRPGMGKSALAACIALNVARTGVGVIEINSEMSTAQMMRRHLTDIAFEAHGKSAPTYKDIRRRQIGQSQRAMLEDAAGVVSALPLMMVKRTGLTLGSLRSMVRRQASAWARQGIHLGLITVDHVGLMQPDGGGKDRYTDQTGIAIGMKQLADDLGVPVIALVQLSRKVEDREMKRPQLADMRDTGAWEENADTVIGVFRDSYYANKEPEPKDDGRPNAQLKWAEWDKRKRSKIIEAILLKVREGEEGIVPLWASIGHNAIRGAEPHDGGFL